MKKDILIDLDARLSSASITESTTVNTAGQVPDEVVARIDLVEKFSYNQRVVDQMTTSEVLQEYSVRKSMSTYQLPDLDAILEEWSWRCDKGYPNFNNTSDRIKLQEVLDEMGIPVPFERIVKEDTASAWDDLKTGTPNEKAFKTLLDTTELNFENNSIYQSVYDVFIKLSTVEQTEVIEKFQSMTVDQFANGGWKPFKAFFDARGYGGTLPGRGEMMAVLAIKGASSGGSKEKDLQVSGGSWEIKEAPNSIRMAKSGAIGKFEYVDLAKDFYKLLTNIKLNNPDLDNNLKANLAKVFTTKEIADDIYKILITNFRGDFFKSTEEDVQDADTTTSETFFNRTKTSEWPTGVIDLHYQGFIALKEKRDEVLNNKELINNAKLILRTAKQDDKEFYINPEDSEEIANAKPGTDVNIKVATPAKGDIVEFLQNMLLIMKHPLVKDPSSIPKDFLKVRDSYFTTSNIKGIMYYEKGKNKGLDPTPHLGFPKDWIVYGISTNGKMQKASTSAKSKTEFLRAQVNLNK